MDVCSQYGDTLGPEVCLSVCLSSNEMNKISIMVYDYGLEKSHDEMICSNI